MKKIIAALTALMLCGTILTACGKKTADNTEVTVSETTTAAETTAATEAETTAAETEAATEAETTAAGDSELSDDTLATLEILDKESPVYANYIRESMKFPICNAFEYDEVTDEGTQHVELTCIIADTTKIALITKTDEESMNIILNGNKYYIVVPEEKSAVFMEVPNDEIDDMADSLEEAMMPKFDASKATFEQGEGEVNGETLPYEKVTTEDGDTFYFYHEEGSLDIKYLTGDGIVMTVTKFTHDVDDSVFEIPEDYEVVDLAEALGSLGTEEE